jgi:hypothetical protein
MPNSNKTQHGMAKLEALLRANEAQLCAETSVRFAAMLPSIGGEAITEQEISAGAKYTHDLIVVAAALYPSENTLRSEWSWASSGLLPRHGIGFEHLSAMLHAYFSAATDVLADALKDKQNLDTLEAFVSNTLRTAFSRPDSAE